jgi:threonine/homoserine/homoserine lactone efflux protein
MLPTDSLQAVFVFSFLLAIGAVVSPGPVSATIVSQAPGRGWLAGPLVASGHSFLELLLVLLITFGLAAGLAQPGIQVVIALFGGILLLFMGGKMASDAWRGTIRLPNKELQVEMKNSRQLVGMGMAATFSNPFWYAWWVTVAAGYLSQARQFGVAAVLAFYLGHVLADYSWDTLLSAVVGGGRRWMTDRLYRGINLLCGSFLIYLGVQFLINGIRGIA